MRDGERAAPIERAIAVTPDAADLSSGATMATVYDCRVGTSISEMLNRASSTAIANGRVGIKDTKIRRTFDGMWVKTIVLISPNRLARLPAASADMPARMFAAKNISQ